MQTLPRSYWIGQRNEFMRRARNAAFYATSTEISAQGRRNWIQTARDMVTEARAHNREAVRAKV